MKFARLGGPFILIEFENKAKAEKVLLRGLRCSKETFLHLERWDLKVGCFQNCERVKEAWVRVVGLSLHFWSQEVFIMIGEGCGGLLQWMKTLLLLRSFNRLEY